MAARRGDTECNPCGAPAGINWTHSEVSTITSEEMALLETLPKSLGEAHAAEEAVIEQIVKVRLEGKLLAKIGKQIAEAHHDCTSSLMPAAFVSHHERRQHQLATEAAELLSQPDFYKMVTGQ